MVESQYEDPDAAIEQLLTENATLKREKQEHSVSSYGGVKDDNLISLQIQAQELLQNLERVYRGQYLSVDPDTEERIWKTPTDLTLIPLNDFGVSLMMEIVSKYIDKNTILSNYDEMRIYEILADIGDELTLLIFCNYEKMGMNTANKKSRFRMLVVTTLHLIESSYRRALKGKTSEDINQSRIVTQSDTLSRFNQGVSQSQPSQKKFNLFNRRP